MSSLRNAALFALLLIPAVAHAQIATLPEQPTAGQPFEVQIRSFVSCGTVVFRRLEINGKELIVDLSPGSGVCLGVPLPWGVDVPVAGLDGGSYSVSARLWDFDGPKVLFSRQIKVEGPPSALSLTPNFDHGAGNRVIHLYGNFACAAPRCSTPAVLFGKKPAEAVEVISNAEIQAVVPEQANIRFVDVTVRGDGYEYVAHSAFTYVADDEFRSVLIPVAVRRPINGAFGSVWTSDFRMVNQSSIWLAPGTDIFPLRQECSNVCLPPEFPPQTVVNPGFFWPNPDSSTPPAIVFYVRTEFTPYINYQLRTRDLSRSSETWGTEIPVVTSFARKISLLDVPLTDGFRPLLRLYTLSYVGCCRSDVKFYSNSGDLLATRSLTLQRPNGSIGGLVPPPYVREGSRHFPLQPAYDEIDLRTIPELQGQPTVWITAEGNMVLWGFVSVTNDATQHVTTITPQR